MDVNIVEEDLCVDTCSSTDFEDGKLFADSTSHSTASYDGSCHCGQIEWTVRLENPQHILCHCDTCKKLGGGPFSCNQIVPSDDLRITKGSPRIYTYTGASGRAMRLGEQVFENANKAQVSPYCASTARIAPRTSTTSR